MAGVRLLQDASSLIGLVIVVGLVCYGLRRGHEPAVSARPLRASERRLWILAYTVAAVAFSAAWFFWARMGEPVGHSIKNLANGVAVAGLRGLATALLCVSLSLGQRLRSRCARSS
jgi:hypothetical protein